MHQAKALFSTTAPNSQGIGRRAMLAASGAALTLLAVPPAMGRALTLERPIPPATKYAIKLVNPFGMAPRYWRGDTAIYDAAAELAIGKDAIFLCGGRGFVGIVAAITPNYYGVRLLDGSPWVRLPRRDWEAYRVVSIMYDQSERDAAGFAQDYAIQEARTERRLAKSKGGAL